MLLAKFINKDGSHSYQEVDKKFIETISNPDVDLLLINHSGRRYKYIGQKDLFFILREIGLKEIKIAEIASKILQHNIKLAEKLLSKEDVSTNTIDKFIDAIRVKQNDPKIEQIRVLKQKNSLTTLDKIKIQILWWETKRDSLYEQMKIVNLKIAPADRDSSFLHQVLDELNTRITKAVKQYSEVKQQTL